VSNVTLSNVTQSLPSHDPNAEWPLNGRNGGTVVSTAASQRHGPGFDSRLGSLSVWSLHIFPVSAWVSSGCSGFLPQYKDVRVRWIGHAKLPLNVKGTS